MSPFFVLIFTCGYFTCDPPKEIPFDALEPCRKFIEPFLPDDNSGISATCIDRTSGEIIISSSKKWIEKQKRKSTDGERK